LSVTDREEIFRIVLGYSDLFLHGVRDVIDSVVELRRVVVDVQYIDDDCCSVGVLVIEDAIRQLIALLKHNTNNN